MLKLVGIPYVMSETPPAIRLAPPLLGEHTEEILASRLGKSEAAIQQLREDGVI
jgi:formyl-CoA transferase/CoA:oxalate CoA-transferase